jgi:GT2 family glycosyltransferase/SAM-dependent methyltransferase
MPAAPPRVSAIIVSYNRAADLRLALEALLGSGYPALEVVVVDNASSDGSAEVAASFSSVRLVRNAENRGFAEANNQGLALAGSPAWGGAERRRDEYVALVNNDAVLDREWLPTLVSFLEAHPDAAAAGGRMYFWDEASPAGDRRNHFYSYSVVDAATGFVQATLDQPDEVREVATLSGAVVMLRRRAIDEAGAPFLEPLFFTYYEETDFFARAIRRGWKLYYVGAAAAWHRVRASTGDDYRYFYYMERNRLLFAARSFAGPRLRGLLAETARRAARELSGQPLAVLGLRAGPADQRARRDAWLWALAHAGQLARHRHMTARAGLPYHQVVQSIECRAAYACHERSDLVEWVPGEARVVVDVGCATGQLGAALKRARPEVQVRGIEPSADWAAQAALVLDEAVPGRAEEPPPASWPRPDCVIFADVLEHLVDPWEVLRRWHEVLRPGGALLCSLPNVTHGEVLWDLLRGRWDYQDAGILDRTHLRFFTPATARRLLESTGFEVVRFGRKVERTAATGLGRAYERWASTTPAREGLLARLADLTAVQMFLLARRVER